jgi:hypothetical protein
MPLVTNLKRALGWRDGSGTVRRPLTRHGLQHPLSSFVKDWDTPLLRLSPFDIWTCRDACKGLHFWGGVGSGKSSSARVVAGAYLRAGFGGCVTVSKFEDIAMWQRYAQESGRANSLLLFDGENEAFNFLDYLMSVHGMDGIGTVTDCIMRVVDMARSVNPTASKGGGEAFWDDTSRSSLRYSLPVLFSAYGTLTVPDIINFISTAPASFQEINNPDVQRRSFMYQTMKRAMLQPKVPVAASVMRNISDFWSQRWVATPDKTKGNIVATITAALDRFNHGRLNRAFCGKTTLVPELTFHGAVIVLAMPTLTWNEDGIIAQQLFKDLWQRAVLSRNGLEEKHQERFLFGWSDEAQEVVTSYDGPFLSLCRGSKCAMTYLTQSLPNYYSKMRGGNPHDDAHTLAGKFTTHVFCSNACPETNEFAARMIGKVITRRSTYNNGTSENFNVGMSAGSSENSSSSSNSGSSYGSSYSFNSGSGYTSGTGSNWGANRGRGTSSNESRGYSESMEYAIEPGDFGRALLTGGPQNRNIVTGVWYQSSGVFQGSGTNWLLARFKQE